MSDVEALEDQADQPHVGWVPRTITGGKGPAEPPSDDWLSLLKKGTVFSCKFNGKDVDCEVYGITFKHSKTVILFNALGTGPVRAVDPVEFCRRYKKFEVLEEGQEVPEEDNNGNSIRPVRLGDVDDDADVEGRQPGDDSAE